MRDITLGRTAITVPQNGFGALPIQRRTIEDAVRILRKAYEGGIVYFDTARRYSDSETKLGIAFDDIRDKVIIATKSPAKTGVDLIADLETSLKELRTDYIDVFQLHNVDRAYVPGDGTGVYEALVEARDAGKIRHFGVTSHKIGAAEECVCSGLYETLQFPFSYLSTERELALEALCKKHDMGFIAMKGLAGGLINNSRVAMAFFNDHPDAMPIWGIQHDSELEEWLSYMNDTPVLDDEMRSFICREKKELAGNFCRGCGYCLDTCPAGIKINNCARMSLMVRRAPTAMWLSETWQREMAKIENCINCRACIQQCPYELDTPELLKQNYEDYKKILSDEISVE